MLQVDNSAQKQFSDTSIMPKALLFLFLVVYFMRKREMCVRERMRMNPYTQL